MGKKKKKEQGKWPVSERGIISCCVKRVCVLRAHFPSVEGWVWPFWKGPKKVKKRQNWMVKEAKEVKRRRKRRRRKRRKAVKRLKVVARRRKKEGVRKEARRKSPKEGRKGARKPRE